LAVLADQAELDGEPEQAAEALDVLLVLAKERRLAVGLEEVGEDAEGVERDVAEDVVEDVRLGEGVHDLAGTDEHGGRGLTLGEAGEEGLGGQVARDAVAGPGGLGLEELVDAVELRALGEPGAARDLDVAVEGEVVEEGDAVAGEAEDPHALDEL